jgi:adenylosuccinate lyase
MLEIETLAAEKMAEMGAIPVSVPASLRARGAFDVDRIAEIEREVKHDVIAFLTNVAEYVGEDAKYMHQGMTSSDILDTALAVQMTQSADLLLKDLDAVLDSLRKKAIDHAKTACIGRSHGIHAEPTTFGLKMAGHYAAFHRAKKRLIAARADIATCAISGPVGTFSSVAPEVEAYVAEKLDLTPEPVSTQVIPRDRHAMFFATLAVIAASIENLATEIRHLQRSEVREVEEYFSPGQKGSSAMPHKRNPVLSENLTGLARVVRSAVLPALENVTLWHERDISHSSVERIIGPDACIALDFALNRLAGMIEKLIVYPERMRANIDALHGLVFSQKALLTLIDKGMARETAYALIQRNAMTVWERNGDIHFRDQLKSDPDVTAHMQNAEIDALFDSDNYFQNIEQILQRALR